MNKLDEIESAIESLSRSDQEVLLQRLSDRLNPGPSCYDLAKDIFEELHRHPGSGRRDLSTNKKYLADLGRPDRRIRRVVP